MEYLDTISETRKSRDTPPSSSRSRSRSCRPSSPRRDRERSLARSGLGIRSILGTGNSKTSKSRTPFFGGKSSNYRRSPRSGYLARTFKKLRRLLRDLLYYMRRHPFQVFMLVVLPLLLSGALTELLAKFGIRLPSGIRKALRIASGAENAKGVKQSLYGDKYSGVVGNILGGLGGVGGMLGMLKMFKR